MKRPHPVIARLAQERVETGVSRSALARRLYIDRSTLRERENGIHEPVSLSHLDEWAAAFGLRLALIPIEEQRADLGEAS